MGDDTESLVQGKLRFFWVLGGDILADFLVWGAPEHDAADTRSKEGVPTLRRDAERGDCRAQYSLGMRYGSGWGKDMAVQACQWLRKSADQGHPHAQFALGLRYLSRLNLPLIRHLDRGVEEDDKIAFGWLSMAALSGCPVMEFALAFCFQHGWGVPQDDRKMFECFHRSAGKGYAPAQFGLARCYTMERGTAMDEEQAFEWFQRSAEQGHAAALNGLGVCYAAGFGVAKDWRRAFASFCKSAEVSHGEQRAGMRWSGDTPFRNAGHCFGHGLGTEGLERDAAAQFAIGRCLATGYGARRDTNKALEFYSRGAQLGNASAQLELGECYRFGNGVAEDRQEMMHWYLMSANQGNPAACAAVAKCFLFGDGGETDVALAFSWAREALRLSERRQEATHFFAQFYLTRETGDKGLTYAWCARYAKTGGFVERKVLAEDGSYAEAWLQMSADDEIGVSPQARSQEAKASVLANEFQENRQQGGVGEPEVDRCHLLEEEMAALRHQTEIEWGRIAELHSQFEVVEATLGVFLKVHEADVGRIAQLEQQVTALEKEIEGKHGNRSTTKGGFFKKRWRMLGRRTAPISDA